MKYGTEHTNSIQIEYETFTLKNYTSCQIAEEK